MSAQYDPEQYKAKIVLVDSGGVLDSMKDDDHDELLSYLKCRLDQGAQDRLTRLKRYSRIDRLISTWQKLSPDDSKREVEEDNTGRQQAIAMNLPVLASHLDDTQAFFAEIFSAESRDFYSVPPESESESAKLLADRMNRDARARKYYKELCLGLRSLIKYNIGGFSPRWETPNGEGSLSVPGNRVESIDMWNYIWDNTVADVSRIYCEAEYAARITIKNRMWLQKQSLKGSLQRVKMILDETRYEESPSYGTQSYYKMPPSHVGLTMDAQDEQTTSATSMNWESYGAGLESDKAVNMPGYEVVDMYCWLNPEQFKLVDRQQEGAASPAEGSEQYQLWRFIIVGGKQVCSASRVLGISDREPEIPHYLGYMNQDDMKEAQRSIMELMKSFQRFASFLVNIVVAGNRKNIWGTTVYDPSMIDMDQTKKGDVARSLASKQPGRDVRTGMMKLDSDPKVDKAMEMLDATLVLAQKFFPSQALPQQIAGIDRAVKNQVAAVLQGAVRRLHMTVRLIDADIMQPLRLQLYRNLAQFDSEGLTGLDEEIVATVLGSGLKQLDAEATASEIKEVIFAILQNPESASMFDLVKLMTYWSRLLNSPSDLGDFVKQQAPAPAAASGTPGANGAAAPDVLGASGLAAAPAQQVTAI